MERGKILFDYKLRDGIMRYMNDGILMRQLGIILIITTYQHSG